MSTLASHARLQQIKSQMLGWWANRRRVAAKKSLSLGGFKFKGQQFEFHAYGRIIAAASGKKYDSLEHWEKEFGVTLPERVLPTAFGEDANAAEENGAAAVGHDEDEDLEFHLAEEDDDESNEFFSD
jgi:hypothetical protein